MPTVTNCYAIRGVHCVHPSSLTDRSRTHGFDIQESDREVSLPGSSARNYSEQTFESIPMKHPQLSHRNPLAGGPILRVAVRCSRPIPRHNKSKTRSNTRNCSLSSKHPTLHSHPTRSNDPQFFSTYISASQTWAPHHLLRPKKPNARPRARFVGDHINYYPVFILNIVNAADTSATNRSSTYSTKSQLYS
jgi:hypothetical protein